MAKQKTIPAKVSKVSKVSKVKQTILAIAIAIVLALFVGWVIYAFYPGPKWDTYCPNKPVPATMTQESCAASGGEWVPYAEIQKCPPDQKECVQGYCDMYSKCQKSYDAANKNYTRTIFVAATIIGLICLMLGGFILKLESVSTGIMGGGVLLIIYGILRYWMDASNYLRVFILGAILVILIWMGYKKLNPAQT
jgi:hypothetical protein